MSESLHRFRRRLREAFSPDAGGILDSFAFGLLLAFVAAAPLPYGGVLPGGRLGIELASFLIAAGAFLSRRRIPSLGAGWIPVGAMVALAAVGIAQLIPLPDGLLSVISPASQKIYHETAETLALFGKTPQFRHKISIAPVETQDVVRLTLAYTALFIGAGRLLRSRARRRAFCWVFVGAAMLHVGIAAPLQIGQGRLHGAFVNPNHMAAYLEVALAVAFGLIWAEVLVNADRGRGLTERAARVESRFLPLASLIVVWVVIAAGLGLTQSRAGILTAAAVTLVMFVLGLSHRRTRDRRRHVVRAVLVFVGAAALAVAIARGPGVARFLASDSRDLHGGLRADLWRISVDAWREFPTLGDGLGAFREAFRRVQPRELNGLVEQAHSDPLQLLVTGGVVGLILGAAVYVSLFLILIRRWRAQRHREESAMILAGLGALLSVALHGLVEFPMSIPAIPSLLGCVLGMTWAASDVRATEQP